MTNNTNTCVKLGGCALIVGIFTAVVLQYVYGIIGLYNTTFKDVDDLCPNSNLWYFMLVLLILNINISRGISRQLREDTDSSAFYITLFIIYIAYIAWGTYEVFGVSCVDKLHDTLLWKTSFITIITIWSVISITILLVPIFHVLSTHLSRSSDETEAACDSV